MISCERSSWVRRLPSGRRTSAGASKRREHVRVEEMRERPVADVMEQARDAQRLDDQPLRRRGAGAGEGRSQGGIEVARPQAGLVHDAQAVREPAVLGGREDPARALELAHTPQPLHPGGVEQVLLGGVLLGQARGASLARPQPLGQLDVAVDRIADEVDGPEALGRADVGLVGAGVVAHRIATPAAAWSVGSPA